MAIKTDDLPLRSDTHQKIQTFITIVPSHRLQQTFSENHQKFSDTHSKMACQLLFLILATCFIMEGVLGAFTPQLAPDGLSLFMTPNDMEKLSKATGELENVFKMIRRRKRSLSSFYALLDKKESKPTTPYYPSQG